MSLGVLPRDWERLQARYRGRCAYCGQPGKMTQDHVVPRGRGGQHRIGNILPACARCNACKKMMLLAEWRRRTHIRGGEVMPA